MLCRLELECTQIGVECEYERDLRRGLVAAAVLCHIRAPSETELYSRGIVQAFFDDRDKIVGADYTEGDVGEVIEVLVVAVFPAEFPSHLVRQTGRQLEIVDNEDVEHR